MRAMVASYPGDRVLIGETYLPNTAELDKWYGGAQHNELQLPMDMLLGFSNKLDAAALPQLHHGSRHAAPRLAAALRLRQPRQHPLGRSLCSGDATRRIATASASSSPPCCSPRRATALMYQGEELGMDTATPTRREDVKDPIGITGWPKEKGRDGERTPMQWTAGPQAGFSTDPQTWLPVPPITRPSTSQTESKDPQSQLTGTSA